MLVDLVVPSAPAALLAIVQRGRRGRGRGHAGQGAVDLLDHLADGLIRLLGHEGELQDDNDDGDDEVGEEEAVVAKGAGGLFENDAVDEEQRARGVEGARQQSEDEPRVSGEGIGQLEGGDVGKRPAEGEEQVAKEQAVKGEALLVGHEERARDEEERAEDATDTGAKVVEDGADGQGGDVGAHGGDGEHEVEVDLDAGVDVDIVRDNGMVGSVLGADVLVGALLLEDGFEGCVAKDDAGCEEAVDYRDEDLHCLTTWKSAHLFLSSECNQIALTHSLPPGDLKGTDRVQVGGLRSGGVP